MSDKTPRMSAEAYRAMVGAEPLPAKRNKFNAQRTESNGMRFDSKLEAAQWEVLCLLRDAGRLKNLRRQVPFLLADAAVVDGKRINATFYVADFVYEVEGREVVEDAKGKITDGAADKMKRFAIRYGKNVYVTYDANDPIG